MTETMEATVTDALNFIDENITVCSNRSYFDVEEITTIVDKLFSMGYAAPEITDPIVDWTRNRMYCDSDKFMNALLDWRIMLSTSN